MPALLRAEIEKLRTTRTFWWYAAAAIAFVVVSIAVAVNRAGSPGYAPLHSTDGVCAVFASASAGGIRLVLGGILPMRQQFPDTTAGARSRAAAARRPAR